MTQTPQDAALTVKATRAVQANALHDRVMPRRGSQGAMVLQIVMAAHDRGQLDLTRREIQVLWEAVDTTTRRDASLVSRVVNELLGRQAIVAKASRVCTVTGLTVGTVGLASA